MAEPSRFFQLLCQACGQQEQISFAVAVARVRDKNLLPDRQLPAAETTLARLAELSAARRCSDCGHLGLLTRMLDDDEHDWPSSVRLCDACQETLPAERLELFPAAKYCAACQVRADSGQLDEDNREFCPRCGGVIQIVHNATRGNYVAKCGDCGF